MAEFWARGELKNNWDFRLSIDRDFESVNDERDVLVHRPAAWSISCYLDTDDRKAVSFGVSPRFSKRDNGLSYSRRFRLSMEFRPSSNIECRLGPSYGQRSSYAQWIGTIRDDKGDHYVCTYHTGNSANTKSLEVYAKDDTDAKSKILIAYPNAQNLVCSAGENN